jgi:hypothetical protein
MGFSGTCAINLHYKGRWANCHAKWGDVFAHASMVFEACHDSSGAVDGSVPFNVAYCPASIDITPTVV